ncbi:MAG: 5-oxoprolinase subunit PxpB [Chitinophagaceae bacterium]|nr:5-oxoprolinase subunit PxpB [Chitinophagaceae bacterium]
MDEQLNRKVMAMAAWFSQHAFDGLNNIIPAYSSLTVTFDPYLIKTTWQPASTAFEWVKQKLEAAYNLSNENSAMPATLHRIPVCYEGEYAPDLEALALHLQITTREIIQLHSAVVYRVYMIGFLPGFAYLGTVDERIAAPRKPQPASVKAGSVGIAGKQTGIYPLNSPGGWNIIGRMPLKMFDPHADQPVWMQPGDQIQFFPITAREFKSWQ